MTRIVLAGAGHAQLEVLRCFARRPQPGTSLTLVTREAFAPYSGMLPGLVAGLYRFAEAHVDAARLARAAGAAFVLDEVCGVDLAARQVLTRHGPPIGFDLLSLDTGASPACVPGVAGHAIAVKPIDRFLQQFAALESRIAPGQRIAVVGAGAAGVELMLAVTRRLPAQRFVLVSGNPEILPGFPAGFRRRLLAVLAERGVEVVTGRVTRVRDGGLDTASGPVGADAVLWTTQAAAAPWVRDSGFPVDEDGFVRVDATLRVVGHPAVFAAGDMAAMQPSAPKSGVYAVRAGPVLAHNLRAAAAGRRLRRFRPQRRALYILSTGERFGVATRNGGVVAGVWVWRVKDWLDRRFVARFNL